MNRLENTWQRIATPEVAVPGLATSALALLLGTATGAEAQRNQVPDGRPFQALQQQIDDINSEVEDLEMELAEALAMIAEAENEIDAINDEIAGLQSATGDNAAQIAALEEQAELIENGLDLLAIQIDGLQNQIESVEASKQERVNGECPTDFAIRAILPNGDVQCEQVRAGGDILIELDITTVNGLQRRNARAICPEGYNVTGGGYFLDGNASWSVFENYPENDRNWLVRVRNNSTFGTDFRSYAVCLRLR